MHNFTLNLLLNFTFNLCNYYNDFFTLHKGNKILKLGYFYKLLLVFRMEDTTTESMSSPLNPHSESMISAILVTQSSGIINDSATPLYADPISTASGPSSSPLVEEPSNPIEPLVQLAPHPLSDTSSSSSSSTLALAGTGPSSTRSPEASSSAAARLLPDSSVVVEHVSQPVPAEVPVTAAGETLANAENQPTTRQTSHEPIRIRGTGHITLYVYCDVANVY